MRWTLEHGWYGCESGCCGYRLTSEDGKNERWAFDHPYSDDPSDEELSEFVRSAQWLCGDAPADDDEIVIGELRKCGW